MPNKPKKPQKADANKVSSRDLFQTPNYAVDLLIPFLPKHFRWIWEPACGEGKIANRLPFATFRSDIRDGLDIDSQYNFLDDEYLPFIPSQLDECMIVTNPPFSLKRKFYERCKKLGVPFALLIPADYCSWIIKAIQDGCERIIPTRRVDYITPKGKRGKSSAFLFHSMWLTWGLNIGRTETFVELTNEMKKDI